MAPYAERLIDGKAFAAALCERLAVDVAALKEQHQLFPKLAVVLIGEDPASQIYVRNKSKQCTAVGIESVQHRLPPLTSEAALLALVQRLNDDPSVNGILVQLPLPQHIRSNAVIAAIDPQKDVDGFHTTNVGLLSSGGNGLTPCTPLGCLMLLKDRLKSLSGARAIVIGRSNIVGKPMAQLLLAEHCTVTIAHSRTRDLAAETRRAEIVIAAVGRAQMVSGDWIAPGAVVIDVGINRIQGTDGKSQLVGDVDFASAVTVAAGITPVPGGVGPMTIACLLHNTVLASRRQHHLSH